MQDSPNNANTHTGTVKWFNGQKGYGFIDVEDRDEDLFVHANSIISDKPRPSLEEGQRVEFVIGQGQKGEEANQVKEI